MKNYSALIGFLYELTIPFIKKMKEDEKEETKMKRMKWKEKVDEKEEENKKEEEEMTRKAGKTKQK